MSSMSNPMTISFIIFSIVSLFFVIKNDELMQVSGKS